MRYLITGVRSKTHLVHIAAYLRRELATRPGELVVDFVGGGKFLGNSSVGQQDVRQLLPDDPRLRLRFPEGEERWQLDGPLTYIAVGAPGIKPWIRLRRNGLRHRVSVVVTDEGIGTYGDWRTRRDALGRQGAREPWRTVRPLAVHGADRLLTTTRFAMYDKADGWALQPQIADEFRRLVPASSTPDSAPSSIPSSDRVVFLSQPWVELGVLAPQAYLAHIAEVADRVSTDGLRLAVRPHPAEDASRYADYELLTSAFTAEAQPEIVAAAGVVGGTSTALLNLAALYGLPAARLVVPGLEHLEGELGADQRALLDAYLPRATEVRRWGGLQSSV